MRYSLLAFLLPLLCASAVSMAAPVVTVLGVPIGGKLGKTPQVCPMPTAGSDSPKLICWISAPHVYKQSKSGMVNLPGSDARPAWAAHITFDLHTGPSNIVEKLTAKTFSGKDASAIVESISSRFGDPTTARPKPASATWIRPEIYISMLCATEWCNVEFMSAAAYAGWQKDLAGRKKVDAARPIAP